MPLQEQYIELPLTGGVDEKSNKEGNVQGLLGLVNGVYDDVDSVMPRKGFVRVATWTQSNEHGLVAAGDSIGVLSGGGVRPYSSIYASGLGSVLTYPTVKSSSLGVSWAGRRVISSDSASMIPTSVSGQVTLIAWCEYTENESTSWASGNPTRQIIWRLVDDSTFQVLLSGTIVGTGTGAFWPRVVVYDATHFMLAYGTGSLGSSANVAYISIDAANLTSAAEIVAGTVNTSPAAVCQLDLYTGGYLAFMGTANVKIAQLGLSSVSASFSDTASTSAGGPIAISRNSFGEIVVVYSDGTNVVASDYTGFTARAHNATLVTASGGALYKSIGVGPNASGSHVATVAVEESHNKETQIYTYTVGGTHSTLGPISYVRPVSKPWSTTDRMLLAVSPTNGLETSTPVVLIVTADSSGLAVGQVAFDEQGLVTAGTPMCSVAGEQTTGPFRLSVPVSEETPDAWSAASSTVASAVPVSRVRTVKLVYTSDLYPRANVCGVGFVGGSALFEWDGQAPVSAAARMAPETPTLTASGAGLTGTYTYCYVLESTDAKGNVQVSPPSQTAMITLTNQGTSVTIPLSTVNYNALKLRVKLYRNTAGGSVFYLTRVFVPSSIGPTVTDLVVDSTLSSFETLYTTAQLVSELSPPTSALVTHRDRLFGINANDPRTIFFTQEITDPFLPRWNAVLSLRVDNEAGNPTALASLDDKLLVFQPSQIVVFQGDGPDATGSGSSFSTPEVVARGVGVDANNWNSVVSLPDGVIFRSPSGIQMLGRDMSVTPIGLSIQRTLGSANVWATRYFPSLHQVWFFLNPSGYTNPDTGASATPPVLVYDVRYGRWSTFVGQWTVARDAIEAGGVVYLLEADGVNGNTAALYQYGKGGAYSDYNGTFSYYTTTLRLPWFRGAGRNGTQRLWKFGLFGQLIASPNNSTSMVVAVDVFSQRSREGAKNAEVLDNTYTFPNLSALPVGGFGQVGRLVSQRNAEFRCDVRLTPTTENFCEGVRLNRVAYTYGTDRETGKTPVGRKPTAS